VGPLTPVSPGIDNPFFPILPGHPSYISRVVLILLDSNICILGQNKSATKKFIKQFFIVGGVKIQSVFI
jgi:hypothetical protein